jgi:hypothetical protein
MSDWNLDLFTGAVEDVERAQYRILSNLQRARRDFSNNRIYPHLGDLVSIHGTLRAILESSESLKEALKGTIKNVDLEAGELVYEKLEMGQVQMDAVEEVMQWALPQIEDAIDEGTTIFEFVEDHLEMEEVGIVPSYLQEGYLFVPDYEQSQMHILQYSMSIFTSATERYRSLRTSHVKSVEYSLLQASPQTLKLALMDERRDLPNPATYAFNFELDFPYEPTVLPVAKRKLMRYLFAEEGLA